MPELAAHPVDATTRLCAIFGHPIRHSASPIMHNAGFAALGLNWRYLAFDVRPEHLGAALEGARAMRIIGLNLTVPHKLLAMEMMDVLDDSARLWGAVNTVRFEGCAGGDTWKPLASFGDESPSQVRSHGFNTDADGFSLSLREDLGMNVAGKKALVLGAGGAGRVVALRLAIDGVAELHLVNRTESKVMDVAAGIRSRCPRVKVAVGYPEGDMDLLINATSLGLHGKDPLPLDEKRFPIRRVAAVYDLIYRPVETPLLELARAAGCRAANGMGMLLRQGTRAFEIWTGQAAPAEVMRQALEATFRSKPG